MCTQSEEAKKISCCADGVAVRQPMLRAPRQGEETPRQQLHDVRALRAVGDASQWAVLGHTGSLARMGKASGRPRLHVPAAGHGPRLCQRGLNTCFASTLPTQQS